MLEAYPEIEDYIMLEAYPEIWTPGQSHLQ